jgi:putative Ca2+/H+ antiporter (TMEM165/GDT1 family)
VLIGSTLALWAVAALAVTVGATVGPRLPRRTLRRVAGGMFIVFAVGSVVLASVA